MDQPEAVTLKVVGAGVGRTGTNSLKVALERLLGGACHHMFEVGAREDVQIPLWTDAIYGRPVDWHEVMNGFVAQVDWPGAAFWPELCSTFPEAMVILSVRPAEDWYRSASNTIFPRLSLEGEWRDAMRKLLRDRFCDRFDDKAAMIDAYERHNDEVRQTVPPGRLIEWSPSTGWGPICKGLGVAEPDEAFPVTNTSEEFRSKVGPEPVWK
jgi:hypothetical protein